jgi:hypothetical protein
VDPPESLGQEGDGPDAARCARPNPVGDLIGDVGGGHHRLGAFDAGLVLQSAEDSPRVSGALAMETGVHSKTSWVRAVERCEVPRLSAETRGFRASQPQQASNYAWLRARGTGASTGYDLPDAAVDRAAKGRAGAPDCRRPTPRRSGPAHPVACQDHEKRRMRTLSWSAPTWSSS